MRCAAAAHVLNCDCSYIRFMNYTERFSIGIIFVDIAIPECNWPLHGGRFLGIACTAIVGVGLEAALLTKNIVA